MQNLRIVLGGKPSENVGGKSSQNGLWRYPAIIPYQKNVNSELSRAFQARYGQKVLAMFVYFPSHTEGCEKSSSITVTSIRLLVLSRASSTNAECPPFTRVVSVVTLFLALFQFLNMILRRAKIIFRFNHWCHWIHEPFRSICVKVVN